MAALTSSRRPSGARRSLRPNAFTLIEVLVVVAIIALLVSILLPSLKRAREMSRRASCQSSLHQQGLGMIAFSDDHKGLLPVRGHFGYLLKHAGERVNFGQLYGKYVGKDLHLFYCPSIPKEFYTDPTYGMMSFLDPNLGLTWGGYMYAAPMAEGKHARNDPKNLYPVEDWHEHFIKRWLIEVKGYTQHNYREHKLPYMQALESDGIIGGEGETVMRGAHGNGVNVLYNDFHAKFVQDVDRTLRDLRPTSGPGGAPALYMMWEFFTKHY